MIKLQRAVRVHETAELPSGTIITVDCNVEENLPEIIKAYSNAVAHAEKAKENPNAYRDDFYDAYSDFLSVVMGKENWLLMLEEFEHNQREVCEAIAPWVNETITVAIAEASNKRLKQRMRKK